jgi:two-component system, cell cycle sensor histidine kinase and response regulator CckA
MPCLTPWRAYPIQGYDRYRQVIFWNRASERVFGYSRHQALGRKLEDLIIPPDMRNQVVRDVTAWLEKNIPIPAGEITLQNSRGEPVPVFSSHVIITNHQGEKEMFCIDLDLTAFKQIQKEKTQMEAQYRQIQKMESIGRLAGGVAHDLNNLLSPILGYSDLMLTDPQMADSHKRSVTTIQSAGFRARDLVRQLLAFSRKQTLSVKPVDLNLVVKNFEPLLQRTIRENIRITLALSDDPAIVMADIGQIDQVIMNLAVNAADAMPEGGQLTIETSRQRLDDVYAQNRQSVTPGLYVLLAVSDNGLGMDKETCENIFEPFFSTKGAHGTGLGLATVYGIVKQHGGNIWVYSEPKKGTTFKIYLPISPDHAVQEPPVVETLSGSARGAETILVVEDDDQVRQLACTILENSGYQVLAAQGGSQALKMAEAHQGEIHLMLTDVIMPGMNGKEVYAKARHIHPGLRVLFMSGYTTNVIARHGILEQGIQFIQKPFSVSDLTTKIRQVMDMPVN